MVCLTFGWEDIGHSHLMKRFLLLEFTVKLLPTFLNFGSKIKFSIESWDLSKDYFWTNKEPDNYNNIGLQW